MRGRAMAGASCAECNVARGLCIMGKPVGKSLARLPQVRHQARFWARRLSSMAAEYRPEIGRGAVYWGEDRQTQGRWDVYGEDLFVLGARMAPGDLGGGLVAPGRYRLQVADQSKRSWWWNYPPVTEHPSVMADSATGLTTACNWDDGGEKQAVGTGPDLLVDIPVPPGVYRLSLYLVNDFNYYEPNREYTIYLLDRGGAVLAACPVRDFEAGVYYHFAIEGPQDVIVRIFRNLSMNTLLQGLFLDRIDARPRAMADAATYGPLAALVATSETPETSAPGLGVCSASVRRDAVRRALGDEGGGLPLQWRRSCTLNGYGAGRVYEERVLQVVQSMVSEALGPEGATRLWSDAAAAQQSRGLRAGASRFTRYAVEAVGEDAPIEARLSVLTEAIRRLQSDCPYYTSGGATS